MAGPMKDGSEGRMSVAGDKYKAERGGMGETVKIVINALILALIVRTFLFQPFNIPSGSMKSARQGRSPSRVN